MRILLCFLCAGLLSAADLKVGVIGTDTSHVIEFTRLLNDDTAPGHVPGARVVAAFRSFSPDIAHSRDRVDRYTGELVMKYKLELTPDVATLVNKVDAILLLNVDGRTHVKLFRELLAARKPVFIDKPLASTLADAREIDRLAKEAGVPWFSASALRYAEPITAMKQPGITGAITWGPGPKEEHHELDMSWYGIHATEMLFTLLGPGCEEVTRLSADPAEAITCRWQGGRLGTVRLLPEGAGYGAVIFQGPKATQSPAEVPVSYVPLVRQIVQFFQTRQPPVSNQETLEIFEFMDAAQRSRDAGGKAMRLR